MRYASACYHSFWGYAGAHASSFSLFLPSFLFPAPLLPRTDFARFRTRSRKRDKQSTTVAVTSVQRSCTYARFTCTVHRMSDTRLRLRAPALCASSNIDVGLIPTVQLSCKFERFCRTICRNDFRGA